MNALKIALGTSLMALAVAAPLSPALAAHSDYLLEIPAIDGEAGTTMEVASWSVGPTSPAVASESSNLNLSKSNRTVMAEPPAENGTLSVKSPRDAASGLSTGRRSRCALGKHFPSVTLKGAGRSGQVTGVVISSCEADGLTLTYQKIEWTAVKKAGISTSRSNIRTN